MIRTLFTILLLLPLLVNAYPTEPGVTPGSLEQYRQTLISELFGCGFPASEAQPMWTESWQGQSYSRLSTGARFFDRNSAKLFVFHAGHNQDALNADAGGPIITHALAEGFDVLAINMPANPHSRFTSLEPFIRPVADAVNYAIGQGNYQDVRMSGLSGGGWTTVVYAAADTRIQKSYPVAGSWPFYLREGHDSNTYGDFEQRLPGLSASYLDLYAMATDGGRLQHQFFSSNDPCCFAGYDSLQYIPGVSAVATSMGGVFDVTVVESYTHEVAPETFHTITGSTPPPPPPPFEPVFVQWTLDDLPGPVVAASDVLYDGSYHGSPVFNGTSVTMNNDYATVADHPDLRPGTRQYIVRIRAGFEGNNYGVAFGKFNFTSPYRGLTVFFNYPSAGKIQLRDQRGAAYELNTLSGGLNDGVIRDYEFRRTQDSGGVWRLEIHINGNLDNSKVLSQVADLNSSEVLWLMSRPDANQYVNGTFENIEFEIF